MQKPKLRINMYAKILLLCTSSILAALILLAALFAYSSAGTVYEQSKEANVRLLQRLKDEVSFMVKHYEDTLISIYNQEELIHDLTRPRDFAEMRQMYFREAYMLAQEFSAEDGVVAIYLYDDFNRLYSSYRHAFTPAYSYPDDPLQEIEYSNGAVLRSFLRTEPSTMLISSYYNENRQTDIIRFAINLFSQDGRHNQVGAVVCDVESSVFQASLEQYTTQSDSLLWMQPTGDRVAAHVGADFETAAAEVVQAISGGQTGEALQGKLPGQVLFCVPVEPYNLTVYSLIPPTLLLQNQQDIIRSLVTIAVVMLVVFAFLSMVVSKGITRPLSRLMQTMRRIQGGETQLRVEKLGNDEIGELGLTFNQMLDQVETLLVEEYEMQLSLQKAQHDALRAQINPHFLYNTLNTMSGIAQIRGCDEVSDLCDSLSHIFRYCLNMNSFSTVEQELAHLKHYIYVMDVRMHGEVQYRFDVDPAAYACSIPRLTLQPIVENAIQHGVRGVRHEKIISVAVGLQEDQLQITIGDNGVGTDAAALNQRLQESRTLQLERGHSIGLINVNARIRMLYGSKYGITVESTPGEGTTVRICLPVRKEEPHGL